MTDLHVVNSLVRPRFLNPLEIPGQQLYVQVNFDAKFVTPQAEPNWDIMPWPQNPKCKHFYQLDLSTSRLRTNNPQEILEYVFSRIFRKCEERGILKLVLAPFTNFEVEATEKICGFYMVLNQCLQVHSQKYEIIVCLDNENEVALFGSFIESSPQASQDIWQPPQPPGPQLPSLPGLGRSISAPVHLFPKHEVPADFLQEDADIQKVNEYLLEKFKCKICQRYAKSAVESICCKQIYCQTCSERNRICQVCNHPKQTNPWEFARRVIGQIPIRCLCGAKTTFGGLDAHKIWWDLQYHECDACDLAGQKDQMLLHLITTHAEEILENLDLIFEDSRSENTVSWQCNH